MAHPSKHEREKMCVEIMETLEEYSTEVINDRESTKYAMLEMLKTHRPVKIVDREYGFSKSLKKDCRLIIKEATDGTKVREYLKVQKSWLCCKRVSSHYKCNSLNLKIEYGIIFVPINHDTICETRDHSHVMEIQSLLKQRKTKEALALMCCNRSQSHTTTTNSSTLTTTSSQNKSAEVAQASDVENSNSNNSTTVNTDSSKRSSSTAVENVTKLSSTTPSVRQETDENNDDDFCMIIEDEPAAKKAKNDDKELKNNDYQVFEFNRPSSFVLRKICETLKIEYDHPAYKLWADMTFQKILPAAKNVEKHSFKSQNIFACLSLFFTGKVDSCFLIQHAIYKAFREDLMAAEIKSSEEINDVLINGTISDAQLEFIAKFLTCRIGIYYNGVLKRFGKWEHGVEANGNALTLILSVEAGYYAVVLNFP